MMLFLVTDGSYSDYHLLGVYSTRELAERAKEIWNADNDIEEYPLDEMPETPAGLLGWIVKMDTQGNVADNPTRIAMTLPRSKPSWSPYGDKEMQWASFQVWASDAAHAVKIANEQRVGLIASGEWTTDWDEWKKRNRK